jgi:DivIVA domain-containing protein
VVTVLAVIGVLVVLFVAGVAATRDGVELAEAPPDNADLALPAGRLVADDVRRVRFGVTLRGYRMSEVDALLERLATQLEQRDAAPVAGAAQPRDDEV